MAKKYGLPEFLMGLVSEALYERWLYVKADAHFRRDRNRGNRNITRATYKEAVHAAVLRSGGTDDYTGELLDWSLICQYDNARSKSERRQYKASLGFLPTVDHVGDGLGEADFRICAWRTNGCKNDLPYDDFLDLCRNVVRHFDRSHVVVR